MNLARRGLLVGSCWGMRRAASTAVMSNVPARPQRSSFAQTSTACCSRLAKTSHIPLHAYMQDRNRIICYSSNSLMTTERTACPASFSRLLLHGLLGFNFLAVLSVETTDLLWCTEISSIQVTCQVLIKLRLHGNASVPADSLSLCILMSAM